MSFEKSNTTNFGNQKCYLRIKPDKFGKSKVSFEKSNATNFGNQTRQILEIKNIFEKSNATNFGNQTKPHGGTTPSLVIDNFLFEPDYK